MAGENKNVIFCHFDIYRHFLSSQLIHISSFWPPIRYSHQIDFYNINTRTLIPEIKDDCKRRNCISKKINIYFNFKRSVECSRSGVLIISKRLFFCLLAKILLPKNPHLWVKFKLRRIYFDTLQNSPFFVIWNIFLTVQCTCYCKYSFFNRILYFSSVFVARKRKYQVVNKIFIFNFKC